MWSPHRAPTEGPASDGPLVEGNPQRGVKKNWVLGLLGTRVAPKMKNDRDPPIKIVGWRRKPLR